MSTTRHINFIIIAIVIVMNVVCVFFFVLFLFAFVACAKEFTSHVNISSAAHQLKWRRKFHIHHKFHVYDSDYNIVWERVFRWIYYTFFSSSVFFGVYIRALRSSFLFKKWNRFYSAIGVVKRVQKRKKPENSYGSQKKNTLIHLAAN